MKKFLAMLMALCMIMSCMTIVTFAEDAAEEKPETTRIKIDAGDFSGGNLVETPDEMMVSTITGKVGSYNGSKQIAAGATAVIGE